PTYGTPVCSAVASAGSSPRPWEATTSASAPSGRSVARSTANPSGRPSSTSASAIGDSPTTTTSGGGTRGSRKISTEPPDRHGLATVTAPSSSVVAPTPSGTIRSSSGSPSDSTLSPYSRTDASAHCPPTNPSITPSARTSAVSPACALVGRWARTTVACTNGTRARASASAVYSTDIRWAGSAGPASP